MALQIAFLFIGVAFLSFGAVWLVRGSSSIARSFDIRPAIVGLTVVSFGTSAPELVVSLTAALKGSGDVALGNIIGSNVANIGLVLGLSALVRPLRVDRTLIRREVPVAIVAAAAFFLMALDGSIGRVDGAILLAGMAAFLFFGIRMALRERGAGSASEPRGTRSTVFFVLLVVGGIAGVVFGARLLVTSAMTIARVYGISEIFIGITMVAIGTSLPELAASVVAAVRGHDDICIGTIVGSNIFNLLLVIALVVLVHPLAVEASLLRCEFIFLMLFSLSLIPIMRTGFIVSRLEGAGLLVAYGLFIYFSYVT